MSKIGSLVSGNNWLNQFRSIIFNLADKLLKIVHKSRKFQIHDFDQLRLSEERTRLAVQAAALGTFEHDLVTNELILSKRCYEILGINLNRQVSFEEYIANLHPDDLATTIEAINKAWNKSSQGKYFAEYRFIGIDDKKIHWIEASGQTFFDSKGKPIKVIGIIQDIEERKKAIEYLNEAKKAAEEANQTKNLFLANVSHEIRTPLSCIVGAVSLLKSSQLINDKENEYIEMISRNACNLMHLIEDLLDIAKIESGKISIEKSNISFFEFMHEVISSINFLAKKKDIDVLIEYWDEPPCVIYTDEKRLRQILINVLGNAVKFTDSFGKVNVKISMIYPNLAKSHETKINFLITDTGCGISQKVIPRLFQPFSQANRSYSREDKGTGLGLALSRKLARFLNGDVQLISSEEGVGSTFLITIGVEEI